MPRKISVLVPVYNTEKYLRECLESLVAQTIFKDLEVICINDGSTDDSLKILRAFQRKYPQNFTIINKKNTGYGDSMNRGLKKATGKYVGILESDDFLDADAFETLFTLAERFRAEVARANYYQYKNGHDKKIELVASSEAEKLVNPQKSHHSIHQPPAIWTAIYERSFLTKQKIDFLATPGASYQDTSFAFKVWATAKRAAFSDCAFLHYRMDNESSSSNSAEKVFCVCDEFAEIERFLKSTGRFEKMKGVMYSCKLGTYLWNLDRLSGSTARRFLKRFRAEFKGATLNRSDFSHREWLRLQLILKLPTSLYYFIHICIHKISALHKTND